MFNITSPILFVDNSVSYLVDDLHSISKQEDPLYSSSYYHLPSPLIDYEIDNLDYFLSHHDLAMIPPTLNATSSIVTEDSSIFKATNMMDSYKGITEETASGIIEDSNTNKIMKLSASHGLRRGRTSKKDRHSKISTAHGLRDRRMRLSVEIARPFFNLQDMLGYDKASRTVEWLLIQSKTAIEELIQSNKHLSPSGVTKCTMSSTSDCEVESIIVKENKGKSKGKRAALTCVVAKDNKPKQKRKRSTTKESRDEARARARQRTLEKKLLSKWAPADECSHWGALEMMEGYNDSNFHSHKGSNPVEIQDHVDGSITANWSPSTIFEY